MQIRIREDGVVWKSVDDEVIVLDTESSLYYAVTGSGTLLWPLLTEGTTREQLGSCLVETYGIERDRALADVDTWLDGLRPLLQA